MKRDFLKHTVMFAIVFFALNLLLRAVILVLSNIPPGETNSDRLILALGGIVQVLGAPRRAMRWLWPGETTPVVFVYLLPLLNCLLWGLCLAALRKMWIRIRK